MTAQLFYEDIYAALGEIVRATGGMKKVGGAMRPELDAETAGGWLKDCLNPARREKLDPMQVVWLLRRGHAAGIHVGMHYLCDDIGYEKARPITSEDQATTLLDEIRLLNEQANARAAVIERIARENPALLTKPRSA